MDGKIWKLRRHSIQMFVMFDGSGVGVCSFCKLVGKLFDTRFIDICFLFRPLVSTLFYLILRGQTLHYVHQHYSKRTWIFSWEGELPLSSCTGQSFYGLRRAWTICCPPWRHLRPPLLAECFLWCCSCCHLCLLAWCRHWYWACRILLQALSVQLL